MERFELLGMFIREGPSVEDNTDWGYLYAEGVRCDKEPKTPVAGPESILETPVLALVISVPLHRTVLRQVHFHLGCLQLQQLSLFAIPHSNQGSIHYRLNAKQQPLGLFGVAGELMR